MLCHTVNQEDERVRYNERSVRGLGGGLCGLDHYENGVIATDSDVVEGCAGRYDATVNIYPERGFRPAGKSYGRDEQSLLVMIIYHQPPRRCGAEGCIHREF